MYQKKRLMSIKLCFSSVNSLMDFKIIGPFEVFFTDVALERFFVGVTVF